MSSLFTASMYSQHAAPYLRWGPRKTRGEHLPHVGYKAQAAAEVKPLPHHREDAKTGGSMCARVRLPGLPGMQHDLGVAARFNAVAQGAGLPRSRAVDALTLTLGSRGLPSWSCGPRFSSDRRRIKERCALR